MTGRHVDRRVGSTAGVRVPWPAPRSDSLLERGDNLVGEFLVVVRSLCGIASEVSHLAAPPNGIVPETALVQIAGAGKRPVLCCRDFKLGARHSTLQAQVDLGHPDVPVRIVPCGCDASIRYGRSESARSRSP